MSVTRLQPKIPMVVRGEARVEYGGDLVFTDTNGTETIRIDGETGSIDGIEKPEFRWRKWCTYNETWAMNNNADMFGGIAPSNWSNGYYAHQMSSDKGILSTFYTNRGYVPSSGNINLVSDAYTTHDTGNASCQHLQSLESQTPPKMTLFGLLNGITLSGKLGDYASVALNGNSVWTYTSNTLSNRTESISIPAGRISTVIFVSSGYRYNSNYNTARWQLQLGFTDNALILPDGLKLVDDLDTAVMVGITRGVISSLELKFL